MNMPSSTTVRALLAGVAMASAALIAGCSGGAEGACAECLTEKCADLIQLNCEGDADCECMIDCVGADGIPGVDACLTTCGLSARPAGFAEIEECTAVACPDSEDECATPGDWTPPGNDITCEGSSAGIGGGTLPDCSFDRDLPFDADGTILQLESADQSVCVRIERRNDGAGSLANTNWTLLDMRVGPLGAVAHVNDAGQHCWYSSHHNFRDWAHVWTGSRHFDLMLHEDGHGGPRTYDLYVYEQGQVNTDSCAPTVEGDMCIDGPIELFGVNQ
jgi:hypothetical protein